MYSVLPMIEIYSAGWIFIAGLLDQFKCQYSDHPKEKATHQATDQATTERLQIRGLQLAKSWLGCP